MTPPANEMGRRTFLGLTAAAAVGALLPTYVEAGAPKVPRKSVNRALSFLHTHTGERLRVDYCCNGRYQPDALQAINHLLRDFRVNEIKPIDPTLLDLLHDLGATVGSREPYHVISGYRSPRTNAMLRERGGASSGVASGSLHQVGKAIDIRLPGVRLDRLRAGATSLRRGGVGYYPSSNFVHVDTGRVRYW